MMRRNRSPEQIQAARKSTGTGQKSLLCSALPIRFLCLLRSRPRFYAGGMKQQHTMHSPAAGTTSRRAPPLQPSAEGVHRLVLGIGQGHLVWLDAGCELRSLSGTVLLRSTATEPGGEPPPPQLRAHAAWRSPQAAWIGIEAHGAPATLELSAPTGRGMVPPAANGHEKSRPGPEALQRLWHSLKERVVRRVQPAG